MRREIESSVNRGGSELSYDACAVEDEESTWLQDENDMEKRIFTKFQLEELQASLTPAQLSVFEECVIGGKSHTKYAEDHSVSISLVTKRLSLIRKKAKFFYRGLNF